MSTGLVAVRELLEQLLRRVPKRMRAQLTRAYRPRVAYLLRRQTRPISRAWWTDRGRPIDRFFVERFLDENRRYVRGSCLEAAEDDYIRRFGQDVQRTEVLDIDETNKSATLYGDLRRLHAVADDTYDCVILTQVLQYIDDLPAAVAEIARILKPGGTALVTVPSLQKVDRPSYPDYWRFAPGAVKYLFGKHFAGDDLQVQTWGNAFAGMSFLLGLAQEDLRLSQLLEHDPAHACIISVRATKPVTP